MKKTIVYLHGYGSSGLTGTADYLRRKLLEYDVLTPDIPVDPQEALPFLKQYCKDYHADLIIGTSMGGMYAMQLQDYKRICVNPALRMSELTDILKVGTHEYFQPTQSGETHFTITEDTISHFKYMEQHLYDGLTDKSRRVCWGFFGDEDEIVNCKDEFMRQFYPNIQTFHGGHRMNNNVLRDVIIPFAKMLLEEEYTDEWGVTYCSYGRILKGVDFDQFTCEEYIIPEGVEILEGEFGDKDSKLKRITLPTTLREIEANTFIHCPIEEIELPDGMKAVGDCMCEGCCELTTVKLPSSLEEIKIGAFNCCIKLREVALHENVSYIEDSAFRYCESLKHIVLPSKLTYISPELFYMSGLEQINIHDQITEIGYWAFWGCQHLKSLTIPESVTQIGYGIVSAHEGFEGVVCHASGYHIENDALIDDKKHELLCCWSTQKDYVVPSCVKRIADMGGNEFVETITVHQPVELTTYDVFASDTHLRSIRFLGGVFGYENQNYWNCPKLEKEKFNEGND